MKLPALREIYLEEWNFAQEEVVSLVCTYLNDLFWFSTSMLTLRLSRASFEAFAWRLKSQASVNHCLLEERSALEDIVTLSLSAVLDQNSPPEY